MKTEFPLLSNLILNGVLEPLTEDDRLIDAQEATDRYWGDTTELFYMEKDLGCLAPPFPAMWIESTAQLPNGVGPKTGTRVGYSIGCQTLEEAILKGFLPETLGLETTDDIGWVYIIRPYSDLDGLDRLVGTGILAVDSAGKYLGVGDVDDADGLLSDRERSQILWQLSKAAFFTISMMNCRNVDLATNRTKQRGGKKSRRKGAPSVEYRTIHLPRQRGQGGHSGATGTAKLHTARGHFKTYTAEAPLMGKHVGTYYWGWQVRGNRENGEVVSSYKVA